MLPSTRNYTNIPADVGELYSALHHAARRVAVVGKNTRRQGSVVRTNTHSPAQLLALEDKRLEALLDGDEVFVEFFLQNQNNTEKVDPLTLTTTTTTRCHVAQTAVHTRRLPANDNQKVHEDPSHAGNDSCTAMRRR